MKIYDVKFGDTEGCDNVDSITIKAKSFEHAYTKACLYLVRHVKKLARQNAKEKPEDRMPKGYALVITKIEFAGIIDF